MIQRIILFSLVFISCFLCSSEGLSRMAVVIKLSGAGSSSDGRREGLVSTARRLGHLSQTARLRYGFRTVDTWNMTTARFRDFLPGRCGCHFHQVSFMTYFFDFTYLSTCPSFHGQQIVFFSLLLLLLKFDTVSGRLFLLLVGCVFIHQILKDER